jgi:shikimate kinase
MNITIVGPRSVGKSTTSKLLAEKLEYEYIESDYLMNKKLKQYGGLKKVIQEKQVELIMNTSRNLILEAMTKNNLVFDLPGGAINSAWGNKLGICEKNIKTIVENSLVFGFLPYKDSMKSIDFLYEREKERNHFKDLDKKELFEKVKRNYLELEPVIKDTSCHIIYVMKKTPEKIVDELLSKINYGK